MDDVIKLLTQTYTKNKYGVPVQTTKATEIFCQIGEITRAEFFEAGRNGLNPSMQFTIFAGDYSGERLVEHSGKTYAVYRTYHVPGTDYLELYVQREGGTNGQGDSGQSGGGNSENS